MEREGMGCVKGNIIAFVDLAGFTHAYWPRHTRRYAMLCNLCAYVQQQQYYRTFLNKIVLPANISVSPILDTTACIHCSKLAKISCTAHDDRKETERGKELHCSQWTYNWIVGSRAKPADHLFSLLVNFILQYSKYRPTTLRYFLHNLLFLFAKAEVDFLHSRFEHVTKLPTTLVWRNMYTEQFERHLPSKNILLQENRKMLVNVENSTRQHTTEPANKSRSWLC